MQCASCGQERRYICTAPVYADAELDDAICPWCIADGSAHKTFDPTFVDSEAFPNDTPDAAVEEVSERTPGFNSWQAEQWLLCCNDAMAFLCPVGIEELHQNFRELEGAILNQIICDMHISGTAGSTRCESAMNGSAQSMAGLSLGAHRHSFRPQRRR